ncbi:2-oxoisovalerate dehydrogenase E2 component (dihydrolipoyl transacylase) [Paucibacter oligotrophus]|uniref:Dihydrolipoamide acetyltransferase component of pyruvate dehydrogenase complex n=1 Tax=Roseateles oligotrophus TaxID=1769250 RepID=A0A840LBI3_9BURK|nr:dihydrolipoamide acetyltransferase family protein [Roseateles oligotrophus]MBB4844012.1 2-oxoisovalerate dehydrogenase E2 component (dihydrolipoyl transacylase) [Roseateles oligotrophus]
MSQEYVIKMPDIGEGIVEVEVVAWRVAVGETIAEDQIVADVMTDKATVEIPSPVAGQVLQLGGEAGELMRVGAALIRIAVGEGVKPSPAAPLAAPAPAASRAEARAEPVRRPHQPEQTASAQQLAERPIASPSLRRRAWEAGVDLQALRPSGPGGRIMQADLDAFLAQGGAKLPPPRPVAAPAPAPAPRATSPDDETPLRITGLRRVIAKKMQESKRRIPHFSYVEEVDMTELEALRQRLNSQHGAARGKLTVLPFLVRALSRALADFPQINARLDDEAGVLTRYRRVHLGIATQTDAGLMVPVLRDAGELDLWACAAEIARLAEVARQGRATRDELSGSTITLSSLGALGGIVSTPVINHPEVAIVGVNRMVLRPMMVGGQVVARQMMNLSSSFDHRVVDGQDAARFIQAVRALLESPAQLFID